MKQPLTSLVITTLLAVVVMACNQKKTEAETATVVPDSVYMKQGDKLISMTFDTLRNSLLAAIGEQGFPYAISFCNEKAYPLTTLYANDDVTIRRASDRFRNPHNQPDSLEAEVLKSYAAQGPSPRLIRTGNEVHYIKPIMMQAMCLNCHGTPNETISPVTLASIRETYPEDRATYYAENDLRGIWHLTFKVN
jgi:hypothetical protein